DSPTQWHRLESRVRTPGLRKVETMRIALLGVLLVPITASILGIAVAVPGSTVAAQDRVTLKEDFSRDNAKWKFVAGQWARRTSASRPVLVQTVETQPWAVAILEDQKLDDVDVTVRFRPVSGQEDASGGIIFRAKDGQNYLLVRANALENNFRLY